MKTIKMICSPGEFTLTLQHTTPFNLPTNTPAAFELWLPPITPNPDEEAAFIYQTYAADYLNGTPVSYTHTNSYFPLHLPFMTVDPGASESIIFSESGENSAFLQDHFRTPTNRVAWVRMNEPGEAQMTYTYHKTVMGVDITFTDTLTITVLSPALIPDYNRDGSWDEIDLLAAARKERFNFWRNDDADNRLDDTPRNDMDSADCGDASISGLKDWTDVFPINLNLKEHLTHYPADQYAYHVVSRGGALNLLEASLAPYGSRVVAGRFNPVMNNTHVDDLSFFLTSDSNSMVPMVAGIPIRLGSELLRSIQTTDYPHALLFEGAAFTEKIPALTLFVVNNETQETVYSEDAPIYIVPIEKMFHYENLNPWAKTLNPGETPEDALARELIQDAYDSDYAPWGQCDDLHLFFAHGYNVRSEAARGWGPEMFKRFYWSGSRAEFHMVHWYGFQNQLPDKEHTLDFHVNVINAYKTMDELAWRINLKTGDGKAILIGHSLGSLLASAAVSLKGAQVSDLVLVNGAVAQEAYDATAEQQPNMIHQAWRAYPENTFASEWHTHFSPPDGRHFLTMRGIFSNHRGTRFHQYYSPGDEATGNIREFLTDDLFTDAKYAAWCVQELYKGRTWRMEPSEHGEFGGSRWMGWGFHRPRISADDAANFTLDDFFNAPAFRRFPDTFFALDPLGKDNYAEAHRFDFLARGIPARTFSIGANELKRNSRFVTYQNLNAYVNQEENNHWQRNSWVYDPVTFEENGESREEPPWRHSDIRDMPYANVYFFFNDVVTNTGLKGD